MAQNDWAIVIGINEYEHHPERNLRYAANDAQAMGEFLRDEAGFPEKNIVLCLGEPQYQGQPTYPTCANLLRWLNRELHPSKIGQADRFWFFFSGHGLSSEGIDYLIPCDSLLEDTQFNLMLPVHQIIASLRQHQSADVVLILDNCREQVGAKNLTSNSLSQKSLDLAFEKDIVTIRSCEYGQFSYELEDFKHGAFTYALLEGFKKHTLPAPLETYVQKRVADLNPRHRQTPKISLNSSKRGQFPLLPERCVTASDVETLEKLALKAQAQYRDLEAERLWWQIIRVAPNQHLFNEAREHIQFLYRKSLEGEIRQGVAQEVRQLQGQLQDVQQQLHQSQEQLTVQRQATEAQRETLGAALAEVEHQRNSLQQQVNEQMQGLEQCQQDLEQLQWQKTNLEQQLRQKVEDIEQLNQRIRSLLKKEKSQPATQQKMEKLSFDLPNEGGKLEFIAVPGGTLVMEGGHRVNLKPFLMGKYPVTQRQYQAVMGQNPSYFKGNLDCPVEQVSWHDAIVFCQKLSEILKHKIDLPSETQWEWAARGATKSKGYTYSGSNNLDEVGWYWENSGDKRLGSSGFKGINV